MTKPEFYFESEFVGLFIKKFLINYCVPNQKFSLDEDFNKNNTVQLTFSLGKLDYLLTEQNVGSYLLGIYREDDVDYYLVEGRVTPRVREVEFIFKGEYLSNLIELYVDWRASFEVKGYNPTNDDATLEDVLFEFGISEDFLVGFYLKNHPIHAENELEMSNCLRNMKWTVHKQMDLYKELKCIGIIPRSALNFCKVYEPEEESKFDRTLYDIEKGVDELI